MVLVKEQMGNELPYSPACFCCMLLNCLTCCEPMNYSNYLQNIILLLTALFMSCKLKAVGFIETVYNLMLDCPLFMLPSTFSKKFIMCFFDITGPS